ncbi:MAG: hypothetical protein HC887_12940 [Desulfobacteraceae bacterium]|nr:hypothetical protein [Desulfobacteraceae bacterium]
MDGLILAAKVAVRYFDYKKIEKEFTLADIYRVERFHYYENSYYMAYLPERYKVFLTPLVHDSRLPSLHVR